MNGIGINDIRKILTSLKVFEDDQINLLSGLIQTYLKTRVLRISALANALPGNYDSRYKSIQRFLKEMSYDVLSEALVSLVGNYSGVVILDYTEIERKWAKKTDYVGILKDGETRGAGFLAISMPYKGRAFPIAATEYSSSIINNDQSSKTIICHSALDQVRAAIENKVILGDREFSTEANFAYFVSKNLKFAIRLKVGAHPVKITKKNKKSLDYSLRKGQLKTWNNVYYKGKIKVNLIGYWDESYNQPLYVITNVEPKRALKLYKLRMKIEESSKMKKVSWVLLKS